MDTAQFIEILRKAVAAAGSQSAWAERAGITAQYVGDVLRGKRQPGASICEALGFERVVLYRRKK